jgi:hypothetical protein
MWRFRLGSKLSSTGSGCARAAEASARAQDLQASAIRGPETARQRGAYPLMLRMIASAVSCAFLSMLEDNVCASL